MNKELYKLIEEFLRNKGYTFIRQIEMDGEMKDQDFLDVACRINIRANKRNKN